ncbi:heavy metal sensor histidine kinase [Paraburkholderia tropica]|uniref:heavy metal sensor histidine kinase n=1 Tax=Paraburkholderia tropica TaxID=92647 RepID=UPI0030185D69
MTGSISRRLAVMFSAAAIVVFTLVGLGLTLFLRAELDAGLKDSLEARAAIARELIARTTSKNEWPVVQAKIDHIIPDERNLGFYVYSRDSNFQYQTSAVRPMPHGEDRYERLTSSGQGLLARKQLIPANGSRPDLVLVSYINCRPSDRTTYAFMLALAVIFLVASIVISAIGYSVTRLGLKPLRRLSEEASALRPDRRNERLRAEGLPVELVTLTTSFNGALERIDVAQARLEGFNADVAHELRTPIANIIGQAQVALTRERSNEALESVVSSVLEEGERMRVIVNDMLFLARADQGELATERGSASLAEEVAHTLDFLEATFDDAEVTATVSGDAQVSANTSLLRRALVNLLVNASQHATHGTEIRVVITSGDQFGEIAVANRGVPIPQSVIDRLFDRFYRGEASRKNVYGNHGLGLSIVKAIAEMHQGSVFARSADGWNEFGLLLPLCGPCAGENRCTRSA